MYKKIIIITCLILGVSIFCCRACCTKSTQSKITTIQFATWGSESEIRILKPLLNGFEKEYPNIKVDLLHIPQNYFQKIHLLFASNTAPDVIFINNQYLPVYANAGVLEDLSKYEKDFESDKFYKKSTQALTWKGKLYAIPRDVSNLVIFYNKDIFKKYNVPYPDATWNFKTFLKIGQQLTHLPNIFGISFEDEPLFFLPYLTNEGGDFQPEVFKNANSQKALKFYADLRNKYHIAPNKTESASATMAQLFLQGRLAMHLSGRWLVPKYREEAKFDWDIVAFPKGRLGSITPLDASGWAISKSSRHKKEAICLIKFLSSKQSIENFTKSGLIVPARIEVAQSSTFLDGQKPKNAKTFLSVIETSQPTNVSVNYREVLDNVKNETEYLFNTK